MSETETGGMRASLLADVTGAAHFACARSGRITAHREAHFGGVGRGEARVAAPEVAVGMMTEML